MNDLNSFLRAFGCDEMFPLDGTIYRFDRNGHRTGWFWGVEAFKIKKTGEPYIVVNVGDWNGGEKAEYRTHAKINGAQRKDINERIKQAAKAAEDRRSEHQAEVSDLATKDFERFAIEGQTPYCERKQIHNLYGARINGDELIVPARDRSGRTWGYQKILPSGQKYFLRGQKKKGCFHALEGNNDGPLYVCEGFATACSIRSATGCTTIAAFDAGNLDHVCRELRAHYQAREIIVCADNDQFGEKNVGVEAAKAAAGEIGAKVLIPKFADLSHRPTDFNDLHLNEGLDVVRLQIIGEEATPEIVYKWKENGFFRKCFTSKGHEYELPDHLGFSDYFTKKHNLLANDAFIYAYNDGFYSQLSPLQLRNMVVPEVKENTSPRVIKDFLEGVKDRSYKPLSFFKSQDGFINLKNGILEIESKQLFKHTPEYFFKYKLGHDFDPQATCPEWLKFLNFVFKKDSELIAIAQEMFGYIISGCDPFLHKAFFLFGEGRNGKSTLLQVLKHLIGHTNCSSVPLNMLNKPFSAVMLDGKLANITGETTAGEVDSESFKMAISGEELIAAQKGFPEYPMEIRAKFVSAMNRIPTFKDPTSGSYEKFCILPFQSYIEPSQRIPMFAERKLYPEMPGILNWALEGYERLKDNKRLTGSKVVSAELEDYRHESDSVFTWCEQYIVFDETSTKRFLIKDHYESYKKLCDDHNRYAVSLDCFSKRVMNYVVKVKHVVKHRTKFGWAVMRGVKIITPVKTDIYSFVNL